MPCYDSRSEHIEKDLQDRLDKLTRFLCEVMTTIEEDDIRRFSFSMELMDWWEEHKRLDAKRKDK